jgi:hypothetical protein
MQLKMQDLSVPLEMTNMDHLRIATRALHWENQIFRFKKDADPL